MNKPQTIQIFLPTGNPRGIRQAEITTRTVRLFDIPRSDFKAFLDYPEAQQVAIYCLFGEDDDGNEVCYIGQTGSCKGRFTQHLTAEDKNFWTRAVIAVSSNNSLTVTHALYLESRVIQLATEAGRYQLKNSTMGSPPHTPAPLRADCDEFLARIRQQSRESWRRTGQANRRAGARNVAVATFGVKRKGCVFRTSQNRDRQTA